MAPPILQSLSEATVMSGSGDAEMLAQESDPPGRAKECAPYSQASAPALRVEYTVLHRSRTQISDNPV